MVMMMLLKVPAMAGMPLICPVEEITKFAGRFAALQK
jgi:hypothetical protein